MWPLIIVGGIAGIWMISDNIKSVQTSPENDVLKVLNNNMVPLAIIFAAIAIIIMAGRK